MSSQSSVAESRPDTGRTPRRTVTRVAKRAGLLAGVLSLGLGTVTAGEPAGAQMLSSGCQVLNLPHLDGAMADSVSYGGSFFAGERMTFTASEPTSSGAPSVLYLFVGNQLVDSSAFPGSVSYTFPADTTTSWAWQAVGGGAIITVSCHLDPRLATSKDECTAGGYEAFGFDNQGDCVSFVATGGRNEAGQNRPNKAA